MGERIRSWWGWGYEDEAIPPEKLPGLAPTIAERLGAASLDVRSPARLDDLELPRPRIAPPTTLDALFSSSLRDRASHCYGKSFRDVVRGFRGELDHPPDLVARPAREADVDAILNWATDERVAVIPYGGGSSVAGGVECALAGDYRGAVSLDLTGLDRVIEIDRTSRAARIQGGALGPVLEAQLRPHGLTLRHFPQSFEFSTLGGWLATRSGGHYASVYTHIEDLCESIRMLTPAGAIESARLPGSGAGPSPDRMMAGSEGSLGVITEAWMRVQERPAFRASASVRFASFEAGASAVRSISQAALFPTNCRLLDPVEAESQAGVTDGSAVLIVGFESAHHPVGNWLDLALSLCRDHGGTLPDPPKITDGSEAPVDRSDPAGQWRNAFIRAPYGRDALVAMGVVVETFETAITWDRFPDLHAAVMQTLRAEVARLCGGGVVSCRFTHIYPDGPAPYFTVMAPSAHGDQVKVWDEIKAVASDLLVAHGATITHHHAVGRDHRPWYDRQRPDLFAAALRAAKATLDPAGIMNPGSVIDPAT